MSISGSTCKVSKFEFRAAANPLDLELFDELGWRWFLFEASQQEIDDDGIIDGLDRNPTSADNHDCLGKGPDETLNFPVSDPTTCAATESIDTVLPAGVTNTGDLLMIAPVVKFGPEFQVDEYGKLSVLSRDPTAEIK